MAREVDLGSIVGPQVRKEIKEIPVKLDHREFRDQKEKKEMRSQSQKRLLQCQR